MGAGDGTGSSAEEEEEGGMRAFEAAAASLEGISRRGGPPGSCLKQPKPAIKLSENAGGSCRKLQCEWSSLASLSTLEQSRRLALHAPWEPAGDGISLAGATERDR